MAELSRVARTSGDGLSRSLARSRDCLRNFGDLNPTLPESFNDWCLDAVPRSAVCTRPGGDVVAITRTPPPACADLTVVIRVMVIEDDPVDRDLITSLIEDVHGVLIKVETAESLARAAALLRATRFDVILSDLGLADCQGLDTVRRLIDLAPGLPVIVLTGLADLDAGINAVRIGAQDYVLKSELTGPLLSRTILHARERARLAQEVHNRLDELRVVWRNLESMVFDSPDAMLVIDDHGVIRLANPAATLLFDRTLPELQGIGFGVLVTRGHTRVAVRSRPGRATLVDISQVPTVWQGGSAFLVCCRALSDPAHRTDGAADPSPTDPLTGLASRLTFMDRLQDAMRHTRAGGGSFAVLFIDLDQFKDVNDTLGHKAGDSLLRAAAQRMAQVVRERDLLARFGGDEFLLLADDIPDHPAAATVARRLIGCFTKGFEIGDSYIRISVSIGIIICDSAVQDTDEILSRADLALFEAKERGRNRFQLFDRFMDDTLVRRVTIARQLHDAIEQGKIFIAYQPQVRASDTKVVGVEALARWKSPTLGPVSPAEFIEIAEKHDLIFPIGAHILESACCDFAAWCRVSPTLATLAVNVSALQFLDPNFETVVRAALAVSELDPAFLELELTESVLLRATEATHDMMRRLEALGIRFAIDDFGTGYSSFSHLRDFRFSKIKIGQDFLRKDLSDPRNRAIVKAMCRLGTDLEATVLAEGVETADQLDFVVRHGCTLVQGYLYARPKSPLELPDLIRRIEAGE